MIVSVTLLFDRGRRRPASALSGPGQVGLLLSTRVENRAQLTLQGLIGAEPLLCLVEPRFAGVTGRGMYLDGIEVIGFVEYRQGWLLRIAIEALLDRDTASETHPTRRVHPA